MMIIYGDCLEEMRKMESNSISAIVTDSPYGISFMGKEWDRGLPSKEYWQEMLRIIKPGGHLLAAGLPRMMHRLICVIEDSGWQVRDLLIHLFGSGFPKSYNHFGIEGYGTALKPAWEGWSLSMKPCDGTFKQNAEKWGQAGINIDGCRVGEDVITTSISGGKGFGSNFRDDNWKPPEESYKTQSKGRWPANVIFDEEASVMLGEPSRFFYCAKASSSERNEGVNNDYTTTDDGRKTPIDNAYQRGKTLRKNNHPTVKPLKLMEYLIKLIMPPKDGILLDPFAGSGTTILAAKKLGYTAIGIEKEQQYCEIARARIAQLNNKDPVVQMNLFTA